MSTPVPSGAPGSPAPWQDFTQDPRTPAGAALRASDRDRAVATDVLAEAYADGRLTREEYDERSGAASAAKTLGDLVPPLSDLVAVDAVPVSRDELVLRDPEALRAQAVARFESQRREALWGFLVPSLICWAIWLFIAIGPHGFQPGFPWPIFVTLGTGGNAARMLFNREGMIAEQQRQLERKLEKRVRRQQALESGSPSSAAWVDDDASDEDDADDGRDDRPSRHPHRHDHRRR